MVIFGENSTSHYSVIKEEVAPCSGTMEMSAGLAAYDNSPSYTIWTEEGQVQSSTANNQSMDANSIYDNPIRIKANSKTSLGNPDHPGKGNVLCLSYNSSALDSVEIDGAPSAATPNAEAVHPTGWTSSCYYIPVIPNDPEDGNDGQWDGTIITDTTTEDPDEHKSWVNVSLHDTAIDLHADTLEIIYGVQDEDNNNIGSATSDQTATDTVLRLA